MKVYCPSPLDGGLAQVNLNFMPVLVLSSLRAMAVVPADALLEQAVTEVAPV